MYLEYWKLKQMPFDNASDHHFFYESRGHQEALTRLMFAVQTGKALTLLTGDYGAGKTVMCETVIARLPPNQFKIAFLTNPRMEAIDLIREIAFQLGEEIQSRIIYDALHALNNILDRHANTGKHCVAIVDEAQLLLGPQILEDLRLLLNHQRGGRFLLTLVLVGQTEFGDMLKTSPQMIQRIALRCHIPHLSEDEVAPYVTFRLQVAEGDPKIFQPDALEQIAKLTKGNPREINALCDLCLLIGHLTAKPAIGVPEVLEAWKERG